MMRSTTKVCRPFTFAVSLFLIPGITFSQYWDRADVEVYVSSQAGDRVNRKADALFVENMKSLLPEITINSVRIDYSRTIPEVLDYLLTLERKNEI
jgi:hypothetical protein